MNKFDVALNKSMFRWSSHTVAWEVSVFPRSSSLKLSLLSFLLAGSVPAFGASPPACPSVSADRCADLHRQVAEGRRTMQERAGGVSLLNWGVNAKGSTVTVPMDPPRADKLSVAGAACDAAAADPTNALLVQNFWHLFGLALDSADAYDCDAGVPPVVSGADVVPAIGLASSASPDPGPANTIGMVFEKIPVGSFQMGSPLEEANRHSDETPHSTQIVQAFWLASSEVTQAQFEKVMGFNPNKSGFEFFAGRNQGKCESYAGVSLVDSSFPVTCVSWRDAVEFANKLSENEGLNPAYTLTGSDGAELDDTANGYRLPTEVEWEYAARAGTYSPWGSTFSREEAICAQANVADRRAQGTFGHTDQQINAFVVCDDGFDGPSPVASFAANPWGLFDMIGNAAEWTSDTYASYDSTVPTSDPMLRVFRGGSWADPPMEARVARRANGKPTFRGQNLGFRLARSAAP
jgi:sulfatase modifying factor 1